MTIESELLAIKGKREFLRAEDVVDWARAHPKSALYNDPIFCGWDEKESAREYWIWGARRLIAIHVTTEEGVRRLVSLSIDRGLPGGGYRGLDDILADQSLSDVLMKDALAELDRVELKYKQLEELTSVWQAKAKVRRKHEAKKARRVKGRTKGREKGGGEARAAAG